MPPPQAPRKSFVRAAAPASPVVFLVDSSRSMARERFAAALGAVADMRAGLARTGAPVRTIFWNAFECVEAPARREPRILQDHPGKPDDGLKRLAFRMHGIARSSLNPHFILLTDGEMVVTREEKRLLAEEVMLSPARPMLDIVAVNRMPETVAPVFARIGAAFPGRAGFYAAAETRDGVKRALALALAARRGTPPLAAPPLFSKPAP